MRCLHCGKQLSLLRRASGSEFCSRSHERQYIEAQESLAVARLIEVQRGRVARPPQGGGAGSRPAIRTGPAIVETFFSEAPRALSGAPLEQGCSGALAPLLDIVLPPFALRVSAGAVPAAGPDLEPPRAARYHISPPTGSGRLEVAASPSWPDAGNTFSAAGLDMAGPTAVRHPAPLNSVTTPASPSPEALTETWRPRAAHFPQAGLSPEFCNTPPPLHADPPPAADFLRTSLSLDGNRSPITLPGQFTCRPVVPRAPLNRPASVREAACMTLEPAPADLRVGPARLTGEAPLLPAGGCLMPEAGRIAAAQLNAAVSVAVPAAQLMAAGSLRTPAGQESLPVAAFQPDGSPRCGVTSPLCPAALCAPRECDSFHPVSLLAAAGARSAAEPEACFLPIPPPLCWAGPGLEPERDAGESAHVSDSLAPLLDSSLDQMVALQDRLEPEAFCRPIAIGVPPAIPAAGLRLEAPTAPPIREVTGGRLWPLPWRRLAARYHSTPGVVKWLAVALPLFLAPLVRFSSEMPNAGVEDRALERGATAARPESAWRRAVVRRAAILLEDDFRSGLTAWVGAGNWAESWSYDSVGLVHPGKLALYRPSLGLSDYRLEFAGQLERGAIGWVYRARDMSNYHAMKLALVEPGPLAKAVLVCYSVIAGRAGPRTRTPLPFHLGQKSIHEVRLELQGPHFSVYVDGQLVHYGSDGSLPSGGIGFFAEPGDKFSLRRVRLVHQDDVLGRLCAWLAPAPATANRSQPLE